MWSQRRTGVSRDQRRTGSSKGLGRTCPVTDPSAPCGREQMHVRSVAVVYMYCRS